MDFLDILRKRIHAKNIPTPLKIKSTKLAFLEVGNCITSIIIPRIKDTKAAHPTILRTLPIDINLLKHSIINNVRIKNDTIWKALKYDFHKWNSGIQKTVRYASIPKYPNVIINNFMCVLTNKKTPLLLFPLH